jgi:threonine dehydrogenase-like Zn-dependent dehydrogenase
MRRGSTVSISGGYGGEVGPMPMVEIFGRGIQLRMGQAHVSRWIDDLMPLVSDDSDPLASGSSRLVTCRWKTLRTDTRSSATRLGKGCIKVVLQP